MNKKQRQMLIRIIISAFLMIALSFSSLSGLSRLICYFAVYLLIGYDILLKAGRGIIHGQVMDECFLMAIATVGAMALAIWQKSGDYTEAIAVMLFYQIGELFQSYAVGKSRRNITKLMDIRPDYANVEKNGKLERVDPDDVPVGSVIIVQPGEKIPIDGIVVKGESSLNTSALTGESLPRDVSAGDEVISGSISMTGVLSIRTTKEFGESTVSKILELVENASSRKSKSEDFISKFARIYTPAVCIASLLLAFIPPVVTMIAGGEASFGKWLYRALTFLVISCPCALVISIPLSFFAAIGGAGNAGILIKGSNYLETLSKTSVVVFDKTGTLTAGVFEVSGIHHSSLENGKILEYAALAESASSHPIAKSIQRAYGKEIDRRRVANIREKSGGGVIATVDGCEVACGNERLMRELGLEPIPCHSVGTIIHVSIDGKYSGHILISDVMKDSSADAIKALRKAGVSKIAMLTGDSEKVARNVASALGIDSVYSNLLPDDKVRKLEEMMDEKDRNSSLAFVGDGINDAPVLGRADIGIAMGAMGSDAAIEASDVVLMDDDPMKISKAIRIAKKCMAIVYENIVFAIGVKLICLVLGALGIANMWLAIFADVGVMVIAVLNAIRALFAKKL